MSREPSSSGQRNRQALGKAGNIPTPTPTPPKAKPGRLKVKVPDKPKRMTVRVEGPPAGSVVLSKEEAAAVTRLIDSHPETQRPETRTRARDPYKTRWKDLTPEEMASFRIHPKGDR